MTKKDLFVEIDSLFFKGMSVSQEPQIYNATMS